MEDTLMFWLVASPSILSFGYAFSVACMFVMFHEQSLSEMMPDLTARLALVGIVVAILMEHNDSPTIWVVLGVSLVVSFDFVRRTRITTVQGGPAPKVESMRGQVVLITGANSGIGKETAHQIAQLGASTIYMACRSANRAKEAIQELEKRQDEYESVYQFLPCDLSSFESVRKAVEVMIQKLQKGTKIDCLILNAGVMMKDQIMTKDGCETMMQANLLGHYLLTRLLLDADLLQPNARVLHLTSSTYQFACSNGMDLKDLFCTKQRTYSLFGQYAQTKLGNILFAKELARRYPALTSLSIHPGIVRTDVTRNMPWLMQMANQLMAVYIATHQKTALQGAWNTVYAAASAEAIDRHSVPNGSYLHNREVKSTHKHSNSETDARELWELCENIVGLKQQE